MSLIRSRAVNATRSSLARPALAVCALLALASCGNSGDVASTEPEVSTSPSPSSTVNVPETVELTEVGADLSFGDTATVIYEPDQKSGTVLELTVKKAAQGSVKDFSGFILKDYERNSTPYYVKVTVENVGEGVVGDASVPLWGVDAKNYLLPPAIFKAPFRRCPSEELPKKFKPEDTLSTCVAFFAPDKGTMEAVSFRPNQQFDPIQWTGEIVTPKPEPEETKKPEKKKSEQG